MNLYAALHPSLLGHQPLLPDWFPLEFLHVPRSVMLLIGLALMVSAVNLWKRKRRAFEIVLALSCLSALLPLLRGPHLAQTWVSLLLIGSWLALRKSFTVRSRQPDLRSGLIKLSLAAIVAVGYGVAGFWLLDERQFGINFNWLDSIQRTLLCLSLIGDSSLVPLTRYATWFLDSLSLLTVVVFGYGVVALFRPIL